MALRTRPRTAAWLWGLTALYGFWAEAAFGRGHSGTGTGPTVFLPRWSCWPSPSGTSAGRPSGR
ncbi:hypothetical protein QQY24_14585 [Streptomyces sp. TG1A-8]|uniref:hypothetical protein n=1 Tax=Streptomyces sp. TG1A-8 TaxID=3051385 RepID=UPI00265BD22D|nr:hypothetical protein [Streptomyces sp. TG1A-8]MDO0926578.1 hypothetical protein [Streptomyces sp. TG1A-8]